MEDSITDTNNNDINNNVEMIYFREPEKQKPDAHKGWSDKDSSSDSVASWATLQPNNVIDGSNSTIDQEGNLTIVESYDDTLGKEVCSGSSSQRSSSMFLEDLILSAVQPENVYIPEFSNLEFGIGLDIGFLREEVKDTVTSLKLGGSFMYDSRLYEELSSDPMTFPGLRDFTLEVPEPKIHFHYEWPMKMKSLPLNPGPKGMDTHVVKNVQYIFSSFDIPNLRCLAFHNHLDEKELKIRNSEPFIRGELIEYWEKPLIQFLIKHSVKLRKFVLENPTLPTCPAVLNSISDIGLIVPEFELRDIWYIFNEDGYNPPFVTPRHFWISLLARATGLKSLHWNGCAFLSWNDVFAPAIQKSAGSLTSLHLQGNPILLTEFPDPIKRKEFSLKTFSQLSRLEHLTSLKLHLRNSHFTHINLLPHTVQCLEICRMKMNRKQLNRILQFPNLKELKLERVNDVLELDLQWFQALLHKRTLEKLEIVGFRETKKCKNAMLRPFVAAKDRFGQKSKLSLVMKALRPIAKSMHDKKERHSREKFISI